MTSQIKIHKAIFNMGGTKIAARELNVSTSAVAKWIRNGSIPNLDIANKVAAMSGFSVEVLRPRYEP
jgi:hypothetical protein